MKTLKAGITCLMLCFGSVWVCSAQYLNKEIDFGHSADFASNDFLLDSNHLLVFGGGVNLSSFTWQLEWVRYDLAVDSVVSYHNLLTAEADYSLSYAKGQRSMSGDILATFARIYYPAQNQSRWFAGLIKIDQNSLDTIFASVYTDTSYNSEFLEEMAELPDSSIMTCGSRYWKTGSYPSSILLYKVDKNGNKLWRKTFENPYGTLGCLAQSIQYLGNNTVLLGACARDYDANTVMFINRPYFALLDTAGNILYSKFYNTKYRGGGNIYKDKNGGYYHWGTLDSLINPNSPSSGVNYPGYVAHLDDSFNFVWTHVLFDTVQSPYHSNIASVLQLSDSNYLVIASHNSNDISGIEAKVLKLSKDGALIWQHRYHVDTGTYDCYLVDAVERPDKSLLLVGSAKDAFNPEPWNQDFWLVGLDSNGCIQAGCSPTGVVQLQGQKAEVRIYPNPTSGVITCYSPQHGQLYLTNIQGRQVAIYDLKAGENNLRIPSGLPAGVYLGRVVLSNGTHSVVKIVYQP